MKFVAVRKAIFEQKLIHQTTRNKINERVDEKHLMFSFKKAKLRIVKIGVHVVVITVLLRHKLKGPMVTIKTPPEFKQTERGLQRTLKNTEKQDIYIHKRGKRNPSNIQTISIINVIL